MIFISSGFFPSNLKKNPHLYGVFLKWRIPKSPWLSILSHGRFWFGCFGYPHDLGKFRILDLGNLSLLYFFLGKKIHAPAILGYHPGTAHVLPGSPPPLSTAHPQSHVKDIGSATSALRGVTTPAVAGAVQPVPVRLQGAQPKAGGTYHKPLVI